MLRGRWALLLTVAVAGCVATGTLRVPAANAIDVIAHCDTASGRDGCNHWYTAPKVSLSWEWDAGGVPTANCNAIFTTEGRWQRSCTVVWGLDTSLTRTVWIGIDRTPPLVTPKTSRPPDYAGWFNHPVGFRFVGQDATSGVSACSSGTYGGPDGAGVVIRGSCRDAAGNVAAGSLTLNYDATPPPAPTVAATPGNHRVTLKWSAPDAVQVVIARWRSGRAPVVVYRGTGRRHTDRRLRNGRRYHYAVVAIDRAGNGALSRLTAVPTASKLLSPPRGARLREPPLLLWKRVRRATYYNVQLYRRVAGGRVKVLSRWPGRARLQLHWRWRYAGRAWRLVPGRYAWYVWPGYGRRSERRYGRLLGRSHFSVVRRPG